MSNRQTGEDSVPPPEPEVQETNEHVIQWDGSEAEMVADDHAEEFDEPKTAVKIQYVLTGEEIHRALYRIGLPTKRLSMLIVLAVLSFAAAAVDFVGFGMQSVSLAPYFGVLFALFGVCILLFPWLFIWKHTVSANDRQPYMLKIYPDRIEGEHAGQNIGIPLDNSFPCEFYHGLILLRCGQNLIHQNEGLLIIPLRSVEPGILADVEAAIRSGTVFSGIK
mgnify:FL=1|jgi:hypothetical protein